MLVKIAFLCFAFGLAASRACEDDKFTPLGTAKSSVKWAKDGFKMSIFGNPDKYIPQSMYISKYRHHHKMRQKNTILQKSSRIQK